MLRSVDNYQVEILLTLALVMGGYALADALHISGPIAIVVAGLLIGNKGRYLAMSDNTRERLDSFWELVDEILNAVLFLLIGLEILVVTIARPYLFAGLADHPGRFAGAFYQCGPADHTDEIFFKFSPNVIKIMTWGGLRGGISVALGIVPAAGPAAGSAFDRDLHRRHFFHPGPGTDHQTFDFRQAEITKISSKK